MLTASSLHADETVSMSLCGRWDFLCSAGQHSGKWSKIDVPSCWELQGFGEYTYGRFYKKEGLEPSQETGTYRRSFTVPAQWRDREIRLVFEGSMTDTEVWIDGRKVETLLLCGNNTGLSLHQGAFTEFAYDLTPYVTPGKRQRIEVRVAKESANKSVNSAERRADWWLFGGIYRPVYLEAYPKHHIEHVAIDAKADGDISAEVWLTESELADNALSLLIDGTAIPVTVDSVRNEGRVSIHYVHAHYPQPKTWDPEHPHLYHATWMLGKGEHQVSQRIGFRSIEFRPYDGLYLNGTRLVVKGTNRHCFWPESGRTVTREQSLMDAQLIRQMNMNAVRCHYPSDRHFLEICDSLGILYLDELPGWQTRYDDSTAHRILREFIPRDVNHPSLFLWSNGNEGGWNTSIDVQFRQLDIQRRKVIHPWSDFDGLDTHHYPAYQTGTYRMQQGQHVFMPTEFLHSKYDKGGGAALEDMWSHWTASPLFAGGFIWAMVDEAVRRTDLGGVLDSDGGNGPDGVMDPFRQPEASFYTIREVWSPLYIDRISPADLRNGRLLVANRFLFSSFAECTLHYTLLDRQMQPQAEGTASLPNLTPGESGYALLNLPADWQQYEVLSLKAYRNQEEICSWSTPLHRADEQQLPVCTNQNNNQSSDSKRQDNSRPSDSRSQDKILFGDDGSVQIGQLAGPLPVGFHAECFKHLQRTEADGTLVHTYYYKGGIDSIVWRLHTDGCLSMDAVVLNDERGHGYKGQWLTSESGWQLGLSFSYPEDNVDSVRWMGRGPYRVWRNRLKGQQFGVWDKAYNNTVTGQYNTIEPPIYPEFKGYYSDLRWANFVTKDHHDWQVYSLTESLYLRLFTPVEAIDQTPGEMGGMQEGTAPKQERTMIPFPAGDISFLLSIPPMQSYKPLEQLGPHAQPDNIRIKSGDEGFHIRLAFF